MKRTLLILYFTVSLISLQAQQYSLKGIVLDQSTQKPVVGAVIQLESVSSAQTTNEAGTFSFSYLEGKAYTLQISFIGYEKIVRSIDLKKEKGVLTFQLNAGNINLNEVTVQTKNAHKQQIINNIDINLRPINNSQEILRMVPGLFIGQHAGGGKAEQIFLRGFDIDHGTDIRLSADGMPVNMVSHAHGQGYADLHFIIPELIENVAFKKGTYSADQGNFSTAGWVDFKTKDVLDKSFIKAEAGQFDTYRALGAFDLLGSSAKKKGQSAYIAGEYNFSNSYFDSPQNFKRLNILSKYNQKVGDNSYLNLAFSTFYSKWNHSGQIPDRAVENGSISHYGSIDDTEGGETSRTNVNLQLLTATQNGRLLKNQVFYSNYNFELFSNFTFFLVDPVNGDQIKQFEKRNIFGYNGSYSIPHSIGGRSSEFITGINYRYDFTKDTELSRTLNRTDLLEGIKLGDINESNLGLYLEENITITPKLGVNAGLRYDVFQNRYSDKLANSEGKASAGIILPKLNFYYTPGKTIQFYLNTGKSYHSNDTRVVVPQGGRDILPSAYGTDLGLNWKPFPKLFINAAAWYLWLDQEFVYVGDAGVVEPGGKTRREGIDLSARYQITSALFFDADLNITRPRAIGEEKGADFIPLAPTFTSIGGLTLKGKKGFSGSLRYRFLGDRPANEDKSLIAKGYFVSDLQLNYAVNRYNLGLSVNNIFNTQWKETQFATESRLKNETEPVEEIHFTAGSPFFARLTLMVYLGKN